MQKHRIPTILLYTKEIINESVARRLFSNNGYQILLISRAGGKIKDKYYIEFVLDDRDQVVDMWRQELRLPCFQVNYGDF